MKLNAKIQKLPADRFHSENSGMMMGEAHPWHYKNEKDNI